MARKSSIIFSLALLFVLPIFSVSAQKLPVITQTKAITAAELKALAKPTNKKPILINFWATWCGPCRVEFPELVEIDAAYRSKGLNFIVVSVDDVGIIDSRVPEFLASYDSTMPSYLINLENRLAITRAIRQIAPTFPDRYPLTLLFGANGKLVFQKIGKVDAKILRAQINKVLPKSK